MRGEGEGEGDGEGEGEGYFEGVERVEAEDVVAQAVGRLQRVVEVAIVHLSVISGRG